MARRRGSAARPAPPLLLLLAAAPSCAFHFFVEKNQFMCFNEEISASRSVVHIAYGIASDLSGGEGVKIDITTPRGTNIFSEVLNKRDGHLQLTTSGNEGPHTICLTGLPERTVRITLDLDVSETGTGDWIEHTDPASGRKFYHNQKTKESLWDLPKEALFGSTIKDAKAAPPGTEGKFHSEYATTQEEAEQYNQQVQALQALSSQIKQESDFLNERQQRFKKTTDATADRVWWLSLLQVGICLALPWMQTVQMKRMFVKKKLV